MGRKTVIHWGTDKAICDPTITDNLEADRTKVTCNLCQQFAVATGSSAKVKAPSSQVEGKRRRGRPTKHQAVEGHAACDPTFTDASQLTTIAGDVKCKRCLKLSGDAAPTPAPAPKKKASKKAQPKKRKRSPTAIVGAKKRASKAAPDKQELKEKVAELEARSNVLMRLLGKPTPANLMSVIAGDDLESERFDRRREKPRKYRLTDRDVVELVRAHELAKQVDAMLDPIWRRASEGAQDARSELYRSERSARG